MKRYKVTSISQATGLTVSTITSFANNRGWSTKGGLDLLQILVVLNGDRRKRGGQADHQEVEELREILIRVGAIKRRHNE